MLSATTFEAARTDEDHWEVPAEWWVRAAATRGLGPRPELPTGVEAAEERAELLAAHREQVQRVLERTAVAAPDVAAALAAALESPATCSPLGAAALAMAVDQVRARWHFSCPITSAAWVHERGVPFAVEASVLRVALQSIGVYDSTTRDYHYSMRLPLPDESISTIPDCLFDARRYLAAVDEDEYRETVERLGELRTAPGGSAIRLLTSFLAPDQQEWVAAELAALAPTSQYWQPSVLLAASVSSIADLERLIEVVGVYQFGLYRGEALLFTALTRLGPDCVGTLERAVRSREVTPAGSTVWPTALAWLPTDAAFAALLSRVDQRGVAPALLEAAHRFPNRALRLLRPATGRSATVRLILRSVLHARPELVAAHPDLADRTAAPVAAAEDLPEVLRDTPWRRDRKRAKPVVLTDLLTPSAEQLAWNLGEQQEWAELEVRFWGRHNTDWPGEIARLVANYRPDDYNVPRSLAMAPDDLVRPLLVQLEPGRLWGADNALRRILARFGVDALPYVIKAVRSNPTNLVAVLAPVTGAGVTASMARWLDGKKTRVPALEWFERHRAAAIPDLIAAALAKPGKDRAAAATALRLLAERGHRAEIDFAATVLGERVAGLITELLETDPILNLPARIPSLPAWLTPALLPAIRLRGGTVLPESAAADVCTMLALCGPAGDYAGVAQVVAATDPESLAEFVWGVFEMWKLAQYPSKDGWVLYALGLLGTDETARRLGPLIREWPGESGHARAVTGLDILTAIGTDMSLMQLNGIAEKAKFKGLKTKAREKVGEVAADLGLTPEELADRLVPDFGLAADGTLVVDYGPRGFVIGFDEQLKPTVFDAVRDGDGAWRSGTARKTLPKPAAKDDPESAETAYKRFAALKKDVKSAAADQIRRFEHTMVRGRRWSSAEHRKLFVEHPLLWHLSRRLVWATFDEAGTVTGSFRIAEDRSYADTDDAPITIPPDASVGIAHPLHLGTDLAAWGELFADYEILQPFPQLQRELYAFTDEERAAAKLARFDDLSVSTGKVLGLTRFGWERSAPADGGVSCEFFRVLGNDRSMVVDLNPGIIAGDAMEFADQKIHVRLTPTGSESYWHTDGPAVTCAELDPITASEVLRELAWLTGGR
ncbi:DUF4132 domain-containing protein [Nocardia sp. NBC_00511]|uniref:DUF4132 domain-containing protein n=1 Tax=Nocardia sp. NBC_00511 TaxID=2903591 RepID=UPI0030E4F674